MPAKPIPRDDGSDDIAALIAEPPPSPEPAPKPVVVKPVAPEPREDPVKPVAAMPVAAVVGPLPPKKGGKTMESIISPRRTIVIDAGHGGVDPGAESVAGYHEKEITLATARVLARTLEATGRYKVVLTRDSDVYLKLHERVNRARAAHGDLFISLHADSAVADKSTRGASIYTLSETASDAESDRYAQRENRADAIGGVALGDQSDDVAGILVDLTVRETVNDGNRLAGMMVDSLEHHSIMLLPTTPHRSAGFAVLKSPDIPSVLIEMGYLSDMADARALADPRHQQQIASAIADGVDRYFAWLQVSRS
jgi:N-acetylmuramoyl-L-alanine amidase